MRAKAKILSLVALPVLAGLAVSGNAKALSNLFFRVFCSTQSDETCYARFEGGKLTSALWMAFAKEPKDASQYTAGSIGGAAVDLKDGYHTNYGAMEGGATWTVADTYASLDRSTLIGENSFDMPSGGRPSPLFGAQPWTQKLLLAEEFGTEDLKASAAQSHLPSPTGATGAPLGQELDAFLGEPGLFPFPTREANTSLKNSWWNQICDYLGRSDCRGGGPIEGRPPGQGWAHQRWLEFYPSKAFKTAQTGARMNLGLRDSKQMHQYAVGEFGPGGLYHNTTGLPGFEGTTAGIKIQFHPKMPVQHPNSLWTFDGTLPIKLLMVRYGEPILMRHYNALPIDVSANNGFGLHTISTHEHNGHNPAESDGYAGAFYFPGQFYDYRWPIALAGYDTINTAATDERAATPCTRGETIRVVKPTGVVMAPCDVSSDPEGQAGTIKVRGDYRETMSTHWFHDHMVDFTSQNVYKGNAAMMNYYSAIDRGNESLDDGVNLRLPSGSALPWGNRDYDVNLVIGDKAWDEKGQLWFNVFNRNGFLGDVLTTNLQYKPRFEVRARRYRFRIANGNVARYLKLALVKEVAGKSGSLRGPKNLSYERIPFHMIANDGNIMEHAVSFDGTRGTEKGVLPTQAIGERYDIIIDFAKHGIKAGDKLYFVNLLEHKDGRRPNKVIPLADVLSERYKAVTKRDKWKDDPTVGMFLRFDVVPCTDAEGDAIACNDPSMDPAQYVAGGKTMLVRPTITAQELRNAKHRTFKFGKSGGTDSTPWTIETDGGQGYTANTRRISAAPNLASLTEEGLGRVEIWHIEGGTGGWSHPVHVHFEEGQILNRDGRAPPEWEKWARKDMFRIGKEADSSSAVTVAYRFREFSGSYVEHCHNTTHEDHSMLLRWDLEKPGQTLLMPSPIPTWDGVYYVDSVAVDTFRTGDKKKSFNP